MTFAGNRRRAILFAAILFLLSPTVPIFAQSGEKDELVDWTIRAMAAQGIQVNREFIEQQIDSLSDDQRQAYLVALRMQLNGLEPIESSDDSSEVDTSTAEPPKDEPSVFETTPNFYVPPGVVAPEIDLLPSTGSTAVPEADLPDGPKTWVLLCDASRPRAASAEPLDCFGRDMALLQDQLATAASVVVDTIDSKTQAARDDFLTALDDLVAKAAPSDRILVFFQGYAIHLNGVDYLLPTDFRPADIVAAVKDPSLKQAESMIPLEELYEVLSDSKASAHALVVNAHSAHPADIVEVTIDESYPVFPFGTQLIDPPTETLVMISRSLQMMRPRDQLLAQPNPRMSVFQRIIMEGLSVLAEQNSGGKPDDQIQVSEFVQYVQSRSEIRGYQEPAILLNFNADRVLTPRLELAVVQQLKQGVLNRVQSDLFVTGLRVFFEYHDPDGAAAIFDNCAIIENGDELLQAEARQMRNAAYIASGDVGRGFRESEADGDSVFAYLWLIDSDKVEVYADREAEQRATHLVEKQTYRQEMRTVTERRGLRMVQVKKPIQVPDGFETVEEPIEPLKTPGLKLALDDMYEYAPGKYRVHFMDTIPSDGTNRAGWIDATYLNLNRLRAHREADIQARIAKLHPGYKKWIETQKEFVEQAKREVRGGGSAGPDGGQAAPPQGGGGGGIVPGRPPVEPRDLLRRFL